MLPAIVSISRKIILSTKKIVYGVVEKGRFRILSLSFHHYEQRVYPFLSPWLPTPTHPDQVAVAGLLVASAESSGNRVISSKMRGVSGKRPRGSVSEQTSPWTGRMPKPAMDADSLVDYGSGFLRKSCDR